MKQVKGKSILVAALLSILLVMSTAWASDVPPSGTITIDTKSVAIGIGFQWGGGVLTYAGENHPFKINGFSVVDVGASEISANGSVYHLESLDQFPGTYKSVEAGIAIGGGASATAMKNQNGVVIKLVSTQAGIKVKLAPEGVKIQFKE
jgi:hypothetical protein